MTRHDFVRTIRKKLAANQPLAERVENEAINADIAIEIYESRKQAGLTQQQLADFVATQQSVIARLEDADYDGHSLSMLKRIANALDKRLHVEFCARMAYKKPALEASITPTAWAEQEWHPSVAIERPVTHAQ